MKKVAIIGGGFAGSYLAKKLEKKYNVILIDTKDYFEFTPGILRAIIEPPHIKKIQVLHTHYLKRAKIIVGNVRRINKSHVLVNNNKVAFDYLVICAGSCYSSPIKEKNIVLASRANNLRNYYEKLLEADTILIIGGGLVGVELCAEIIQKYPYKKVIIVHAGDKLIERNHERAIKYAEKFLIKRGVKIIYNEKINCSHNHTFITNKGTKIKSNIAFWCTGIKPNTDFLSPCLESSLNQNNQIIVNSYLQVKGYKNIFAAGDINDLEEEKTAQNAKRQAKIAEYNINALEENKSLKDYESKQTPLVISLGKYSGIFSWGKIVIKGFAPGILKTVIEKKEMLAYKF